MRLTMLMCVMALVACEGPEGPQGATGPEGPQGPAGEDGLNGEDGATGEDGNDADCYGRDPVDVTGVSGGDPTLFTNVPTDFTLERAGTEALTVSVAGAGIEYSFDGDDFTATALNEFVTSQVFIATDGCTVDTFTWMPQAVSSDVTVDVVNLIDGPGVLGAGVQGEDSFASLAFEERQRVVLPFGEYTFDARVSSAPVADTGALTLEPGSAHVLVLHTDGETRSILNVDLGRNAIADPENDLSLVGIHAAGAGVGEVDVYDVYTDTLLFEDLVYGTSEDLGDVAAVDYGLALDLDDDGETDLDLALVPGGAFAGNRVAAAAYLNRAGDAKVFAVDVDADVDAILSTVQEVTLEPGAFFDSSTDPYEDSVTVAGCPVVERVNVTTDISHTFRSDLVIALEGPSGTTSLLWNEDGGFDSDVYGEFDEDSGVDLSGDGEDSLFTRPSLADFSGSTGNGPWTLTVEDLYSGDSGTVNSWTLRLDCPL